MPGIREGFRMSNDGEEMEDKAALTRAESQQSREQVDDLALVISLANWTAYIRSRNTWSVGYVWRRGAGNKSC